MCNFFFETKCNIKAKIKRLFKLYHLFIHLCYYLNKLNINILDVVLQMFFIYQKVGMVFLNFICLLFYLNFILLNFYYKALNETELC